MRLAFVTALIPVARPDTGFEIANAAILDALRGAGHEVIAFGFVRPGEVPADAEQAVVIDRIAIENAAVGPGQKLRWLAAAARSGLPVAGAKLRLAGSGLVEAVRSAGPFDAIVINSVMPWAAFPELATLGPRILVAHNIEHVSARQNAAHGRNPLTRILYAREARLLESVEREAFAAAAFIWTLAEEDRAALGPAAEGRSAVLPLVGAPKAGAAVSAGEFPHDIGLIGTWTWTPNRIGLDWFLREVCPLLPADLRVAVAGRLPDGMPPPPDNVALLGRVPDADAFLDGCCVVALTSRAGTGVQLKTIEAMQLGLPAVATTLSCRGFTRLPDNFIVADEPAAFARHLAGTVERVRGGDRLRRDGEAFMAGQRAALAAAIELGLVAAR